MNFPTFSSTDPSNNNKIRAQEACKDILAALNLHDRNEEIHLRDSLSRVLAETIEAPWNVPSHRLATADGIALNSSDLPDDGSPRTLRNVATVVPGKSLCDSPIYPGECAHIKAGAMMPNGCDTVIPLERLKIDTDEVTLIGQHSAQHYVQQIGEALALGEVVFEAGHILTANDLGILASLGIGAVRVSIPPKVAFFSTGDDIRAIGQPLEAGQRYDSHRHTMQAMLRNAGVESIDLGVVNHQPQALKEALKTAARKADIVISSSSLASPEPNALSAALAEFGDMHSWDLAIKPVQSLVSGTLRNSYYFGLSGSAEAVVLGFYQFIYPTLYFLQTGKKFKPLLLRAICTNRTFKTAGHCEFARGYYYTDDSDFLHVVNTSDKNAAAQAAQYRDNCFIVLEDEQTDVAAGMAVKILPFSNYRFNESSD